MKRNLSPSARLIRILIGMLFVVWGAAGGPGWTFLGIFPILTGCFGYSPTVPLLEIRRRLKSNSN